MSAGKAPSVSRTVQTQLVFPEHANALGKAFGGQVMSWLDMVGGICAMRHVGGLAVTASVDDLVFERPLVIGDVAVIEARVNAAFRTSLEVEVTVHGERMDNASRWRCVTARFTFVAIDGAGQPCAVTPLQTECDDDVRRERAATVRRDERLARRRSGAE
ncbi:MAG: acyl-CoA thioesterase [Deltaproteobacteria bacterium]|nr:acyl-CoA thioesterase [Deltaproteobacteria bacterium]